MISPTSLKIRLISGCMASVIRYPSAIDMPPKTKGLSVELPAGLADEIAEIARTTHRSTAFIARRALAAALGAKGSSPGVPNDPAVRTLALTTDEEDPGDLLAKLRALGGS